MARAWRKLGPKSAKKPVIPQFAANSFLLSFSLHHVFNPWIPHINLFLHQQTATQPPYEPTFTPAVEQQSWTPPSPLCRFSSSSFPSFATDRQLFHHSSRRCRPNHQLSLLIMVVTIAFSSLLLRLSPSSATILVAWRTWITVHIMQIIHLYGGSYLIWPSSDGWAWSGPPPKRKKHLLGKISPIFFGPRSA